jgi:hypothetical protein
MNLSPTFSICAIYKEKGFMPFFSNSSSFEKIPETLSRFSLFHGSSGEGRKNLSFSMRG